jgi:RNA polymerase sigma factor (sigma-70 family)
LELDGNVTAATKHDWDQVFADNQAVPPAAPTPSTDPSTGESPPQTGRRNGVGPSLRQRLKYDLNLTKMEDEQLVVLAQECDYRPSRDELIRRYTPLTKGIVRRYAGRAGLQEADCLDALQDAVLWIMEAIRQYRTAESVQPQGCRFRTFLHRVLISRLVDFMRRYRRLRNHFPVAGGVAGVSRGPGQARDAGEPEWDGLNSNPLTSVEEDEVQTCLHRELGRLVESDRRLWDLLAGETPLRKVAAALGISYDAAKRRRRKLLGRLRGSLAGK